MNVTDEPRQKTRLIPRWLKWVLIALIPIGCAVLGLLALDATGEARLRAVLAEARRDGSPLTFAEIEARRKVWPEETNGARIIEAASERLQEIQKNDDLKRLLEAAPIFGDADEPELGHRWPAEQVEAGQELLRRFSDTLDEIDRLAEYEGGRFKLQPASNPIDTLLPHLSIVRTSAKLKMLQMLNRVMTGRNDSIAQDVTVLARHGKLLADEPTIISALVGTACDSLTVQAVERACGLTTISPEQLAAIERILAGMENPQRLYWGMLGERALFVGGFDALRRNDPSARNGLSSMGLPDIPGQSVIPGVRGWLTRDEAVGLGLHNRMVPAAKDPIEAAQVCAQIDKEIVTLPKYCLITSILIPSLQRACTLHTMAVAQVRAARTAMAVERCRVEEGHFPASLDVLVPDYLDAVPIDPFDGKPLRYKLDDNGAVIYSIGDDGTDHGGAVRPLGKSGKAPDTGFRLLAPARRGLPPPAEPSDESASNPAP